MIVFYIASWFPVKLMFIWGWISQWESCVLQENVFLPFSLTGSKKGFAILSVIDGK